MPKLGFVYTHHIRNKFGVNTNLPPEQWAYIAGIFDGEGSITSSNGYYRIDIYQKSGSGLLEWLQLKLGAGNIGPCGSIQSLKFLQTMQVVDIIQGILPYCIVKKAKCIEALDALTKKYDL